MEVRISGSASEGHEVTCVIPGHERTGEELHAELLRVDDVAPFKYEYRGVCGYGSDFDYSSEEQG